MTSELEKPAYRLVVYVVGVAGLFVILFGIRGIATVLNPILLALVITITVLPIPSRLTQRGLPGWMALIVTILMVVLLLGLVIVTVFFSVTQLSTELAVYLNSAAQQATNDLSNSVAGENTAGTVSQISIQLGVVGQQLILIILNILVQFGIALAIFFFMISAAISMRGVARMGLNPDTPIIGRISSLTEDVRHYMTILTGVNFMVGLGNTVFLLFLGVDYAVLWGILAWFMGYIPSIGFMIALIPPVILAYAQYGMQTALIVLVGYILINGGVQNFIQPKIMGQGLRISPVVVFVSVFVWGFLLGGIGAILAVPMTLLVLVILDNFDNTRTLARLMRFTGQENKGEQRAATQEARRVWNKVKNATGIERKDKVE
jgi:predicted PurR-regulated permease PerM